MRHSRFLFYFAVALTSVTSLGSFAAEGELPFFGEYHGDFTATGRAPQPAYGTVVSEGPGLYHATVQITTDGPQAQVHQLEIHGHVAGPRVMFYGYSQSVEWVGTVQDGVLNVQRKNPNYGGAFELKRVIRHSPTEGMAPPAGAVVLLPFEEGKAPDMAAWTNEKWEALPDGSMRVAPRSGNNFTKEPFGDCELHLEFWAPHEAVDDGQGRANSGCYLQGRYEVQILDSFGVFPGSGDCGAIYEVAPPRVNVCYPPDQWQTYDITFRAPRLNADGSVKEPARLTVKQNGVLIHEDQPVDHVTRAGKEGPLVERDALMLQDHGDPVRYRNIWLLPLEQ